LEQPLNYNLEGKIFKSISNTENGEVSEDTIFHYHQNENIVWADYSGGSVVKEHLIANVIQNGKLDMRYHHINTDGKIMLGKCLSTPSITKDGLLKFNEEWQWLSEDKSSGHSEIIEVKSV
jgi:hypothetical protein